MRRHLVRLVAMTATLAMLVPSAAHGDTDPLMLSRNGVAWSSSLQTPLFDPDQLWVPGDTQTASFYARNLTKDPANLAIDIMGAEVDSLLRTGDLTVSTRTNTGRWVTISDPGWRQLSRSTVDAGAWDRVQVRVALDPASSNQSQIKSLQMRFFIRLTQAGEGGADPGTGTNPGTGAGETNPAQRTTGLLPDAGAPALLGLIAAALAAIGLGMWSARRQETRHG